MEQNISIKNLCFQVAVKWKIIIILSLVFGCGFGVYKGFDSYMLSNNAEKVENLYEMQYIEFSANEAKLEKVTNEYEILNEYYTNSYVMNVDPHNLNKVRISLHIDSLYSIYTDKSEQETDNIHKLMGAYNSNINYGSLFEEISSYLELKESKYVEEIVKVTNDTLGMSISFDITMQSKEEVVEVINIIYKYLYRAYDIINREVAEHSISFVENDIITYIDEIIRKNQIDVKYDVISKKIEIQELTEQGEKLKEPVRYNVSASDVAFIIFKNAIIGTILGIILFTAIVLFMSILSNNLQDETIIENFLKLNVLGINPVYINRKNIIDCQISKIFNDSLFKDEEEFYEFVSMRVRKKNVENIHLTGTIEFSDISNICNILTSKLDNTITCGGYLEQDLKSYETITTSESVILIEKRFKTDMVKLHREVNTIREMNKDIIGVILL